MPHKHSWFYRNSLSIVFAALMILSLIGQIYTGWLEHNVFLQDHEAHPETMNEYLGNGHFLQATFENWESEFLQMALFVVLTIFLRQQGSSESKDCDDKIFDESELIPKKNSPWPVKKGGIYLSIYKHTLSISLFLLFFISFFLHWYGSWLDYNEKQTLEDKNTQEFFEYLGNKKFWFESFQNWQSEFLSIFSIIFLSIYLREYGSSQSKRINDSNMKTD
jgi:hypothetical protein